MFGVLGLPELPRERAADWYGDDREGNEYSRNIAGYTILQVKRARDLHGRWLWAFAIAHRRTKDEDYRICYRGHVYGEHTPEDCDIVMIRVEDVFRTGAWKYEEQGEIV